MRTDAGLMGSHKVLPFSEKVKVLDVISKEKASCAWVGRATVRANFL